MPRATVLTVAAALLALAAPHAASAKAAPKCPARAGTLGHDSYGRAWHARGSLYACTTVYGRRPRAIRMGPYRAGMKLAWHEGELAWSLPSKVGGKVVDRLYAGNAEDGSHWLLGPRAFPASAAGEAHEARVQRVFSYDAAAAWVTTGGAVVFAVRDPQDEPTAIGALPNPPRASSHMVLLGAWPGGNPTDLGRTARLEISGEDGDECGGAQTYAFTIVPDAATGARVGVTWDGGWTRPYCG